MHRFGGLCANHIKSRIGWNPFLWSMHCSAGHFFLIFSKFRQISHSWCYFQISRFLTLSDLTISPEIFLMADWGWNCSLVRDCALGLAEFSLVSQLLSLLEFCLQLIGPLKPEKRECEMRDSCALMSASSLRPAGRSKPQSVGGPRWPQME